MTLALFTPAVEGLTVLRGFALDPAIMTAIDDIAAISAFRHMSVPSGHAMSVATTSCGAAGWISDARGYRYAALDPLSGAPWPALPSLYLELARDAAAKGGFAGFVPDSCLINRYAPEARMGLHQDKDERDFGAPIVSVSLGLSAIFLWGNATRRDRPERVDLHHGDVVVWGGDDRLRFHGVAPLKPGAVPFRYNLTFRKAL